MVSEKPCVCVSVCRYRGDEDLQSILLGADIFSGIDHRPCGPAAVQLHAHITPFINHLFLQQHTPTLYLKM